MCSFKPVEHSSSLHLSLQFPIPRRLCSLTISRLSLLTPLPADLSSLSLAVKMQSSKRTLRSHEIPVPQSALLQLPQPPADRYTAVTDGRCGTLGGQLATGGGGGMQSAQAPHGSMAANSGASATLSATSSCGAFGSLGTPSGGANVGAAGGGSSGGGGGGGGSTAGGQLSGGGGGGVNGSGGTGGMAQPSLLETDLDLHFSLQYPHFIKRDGNRLVCVPVRCC